MAGKKLLRFLSNDIVWTSLQKYSSLRRNRFKNSWAVGCNHDLQLVPESQPLQFKHQQLLNVRMKARFNLVDENKCIAEFGNIHRKTEQSPLTRRHMEFGIPCMGAGLVIAFGEEMGSHEQ